MELKIEPPDFSINSLKIQKQKNSIRIITNSMKKLFLLIISLKKIYYIIFDFLAIFYTKNMQMKYNNN